MDAHSIALAFNQVCDKKTWTARAYTTKEGANVIFTGSTGMVQLTYSVDTGRFAVAFNKVHAAWGDYVKAVARALYTVLSTLKCAGLPFEAPPSPAGIELVVTASDDSTVYARWPGERPATLADALVRDDPLMSQALDGFLVAPLNSL